MRVQASRGCAQISVAAVMGSIGMDKERDMALGFSGSTRALLHPFLAFTGRVPSDPLNTMESLAPIFRAKGSATDANRWGDYSSMAIDPSDVHSENCS